MNSRWSRWSALSLLAFGVVACERVAVDGALISPAPAAGASEPPAEATPPPAPGRRLRIDNNTQATIDDVRIGVGNIWDEAYTDESGAQENGLRAGLWLSFRDEPSGDRTMRVYAGQKVAVGNLRIEVTSVQKAGVDVVLTR